MNKKAAIVITALSAVLFTTTVLAQDSVSTVRPILQNRIQKTDVRIVQIGANIQQKLQEMEQARLAEASQAAIFRQKLEDRRLKIASHEAEMKAKIQAFRDKQKAEIAERVNTNLNKINQNQTDGMIRSLDLMSVLLDKLDQRVASNSPDIKDPAAANQAIADARAAIASARTAVEAQAQKDYSINVTTEARIRQDAQAQRDQLFKDIMAVRKMVIDAKQAVANAIRVAKSGKIATPSAEVKEGTISGQQ